MVRFQLQIGDVVNYKGIPVKIIGISSAGVDAVDDNNEGYILSILDIEPIDITDGILKKLGFVEKAEGCWEYKMEPITIDMVTRVVPCHVCGVSVLTDVPGSFATQGSVFNLRYVHELQQFIRLCWVGEHPSDGVYLRGNLYEKMV